MNDLLTEQVLTAEDIITKFLGRPVLERQVTDFYKPGTAFELSGRAYKAGTLTAVKYVADTKRTRTVTTGLFIDTSDRHPCVHLPPGDYPTCPMVANPFSITYTGGFILEDKGWPTVRQAVKNYVGQFFYQRGSEEVSIDLRPIERMLLPYRNAVFA